MPILPPQAFAPYDTVQTALDLARTRLLDAIVAIGGDIVTDTQPFTQPATNGAWRRLQEFLSNLGWSRLKSEAVLLGLPACLSTDPGVEVWLNWTQYFDGVATLVPPDTPVLPRDFISPLRIWERPSNPTAPGNFYRMDRMKYGIPNIAKVARNWRWDWRQDALFLPGALVATDLRLRYNAFLPDFLDAGDTPWYNQPIPITRAQDALAWYICFEISNARGDLDSAAFDAKAVNAATILFHRDLVEESLDAPIPAAVT